MANAGMIRKYFPVTRAAGAGPDAFFISMQSPDLEGDQVVPEGAELADYVKNPVVLYLHDGYGKTATVGLPVGTTKALEVVPGVGIKAHGINWLKPPRPPAVDWIESAWRQKVLRGASIGFVSTGNEPNRQTGGRTHRRWKLLEWSIVPLPMHPGAIRNSADRAMLVKALGLDDAVEVPLPHGGKLFVIDESMKSRERVAEALREQKAAPREVQTLLFDPGRFDADAARAWAEEHDFRRDKVDETDGAIRLRQFDPADCVDGTQRTIRLADGVQAVVCQVGAGKAIVGEPGEKVARLRLLAAGDLAEVEDDPIRWNKSLGEAFDVAAARVEPERLEFDFAARYIGCEVKELYQGGTQVPAPKIGSFLSALDEELASWRVDDLRNLKPEAREAPPVHEVVPLRPGEARDFLVHGTRFMRGADESRAAKVVLRVAPSWVGLDVTTYARDEQARQAIDLVERVWARARELNYLKGQAFALSGDFIAPTEETWGDLFLAPENRRALERAAATINRKGAASPNRGILALGPPGTGKTMSARVMRNETEATFIHVSARDFHRAGAFGGITYAYDLAKECAPSIVVFEDVDNWLGPTTIDLLKTEMDGVARTAGITTVITTNFPERFPEALIDRPGRIHDVLDFALPSDDIRAAMIARWLPDLDPDARALAVGATVGYSGAHVRELARFVDTLREQDDLEPADALARSVEKLREQRALIDDVQLRGSRYRPAKEAEAPVRKAMGDAEPGASTSPVCDDARGHAAAAKAALTQAIGSVASAAACCAVDGRDDAAEAMTDCQSDLMDCMAELGECAAMLDRPAPAYVPMTAGRAAVRKEGRVLSQRNFEKVEQCHTMLGEVLDSARREATAPAKAAATCPECGEKCEKCPKCGKTAMCPECRECAECGAEMPPAEKSARAEPDASARILAAVAAAARRGAETR